MLKKENRLVKEKDFDLVFKRGKGIKEGFLFFKFFANEGKEPEIGFVVSNKISNKAVVRNKIKRRMREAIRPLIENCQNGFKGVFVALPGIEKEDFKGIEESIKVIFKKTKIIK